MQQLLLSCHSQNTAQSSQFHYTVWSSILPAYEKHLGNVESTKNDQKSWVSPFRYYRGHASITCIPEISDVVLRFWGSVTVPRYQGGVTRVILPSFWMKASRLDCQYKESRGDMYHLCALHFPILAPKACAHEVLDPPTKGPCFTDLLVLQFTDFLTNFLRILLQKAVGKSDQLTQTIMA